MYHVSSFFKCGDLMHHHIILLDILESAYTSKCIQVFLFSNLWCWFDKRNYEKYNEFRFCNWKKERSINVWEIHSLYYIWINKNFKWLDMILHSFSSHESSYYSFLYLHDFFNWVKSLIFLVKIKFWINDIMFALRIHNEHDFHWKKRISLLELVWNLFHCLSDGQDNVVIITQTLRAITG